MLIVISPAKTLDYESPVRTRDYSQPEFLKESRALVKELRTLSPEDISELMHVSPKIAELNFGRYLNWKTPFSPDNARPALYAFKGDVYTGIEVENYGAADLRFAQRHLRILSGLYGLLRPLDLMQPYRLEMGTKFANARGRNLYEFWGGRITSALNRALAEQKDAVLVNLASNEYFRAVDPARLRARVITPVFKDSKDGACKVITFYAKKARGMMTSWIVHNRVKKVKDLEKFDVAGYRFNPGLSKGDELVFTRDAPTSRRNEGFR